MTPRPRTWPRFPPHERHAPRGPGPVVSCNGGDGLWTALWREKALDAADFHSPAALAAHQFLAWSPALIPEIRENAGRPHDRSRQAQARDSNGALAMC